MAENVEFLIDAQYPNRRAVEDFLKDVKEVKATLASFGKEARAVKALSASVAKMSPSTIQIDSFGSPTRRLM